MDKDFEESMICKLNLLVLTNKDTLMLSHRFLASEKQY